MQKLLDKIEGKPEEPLLARLVLRSMKQAKYTTQCTGHFGLAARYYTHFTSPIRRFPDLTVHRLVRNYLFEKKFVVDDQKAVLFNLAKQHKKINRLEKQRIMC
jgi:exoribonuclease R